MKKRAVFLSLFAVFALSLYAQETVKTAHFEIAVENNAGAAADLLAKELELRFDVYNRLFRFDPETLSSPLRARVFTDQAGYDAYVSARLGATRPGAVYFHYNHADRRELVVLLRKGRRIVHTAPSGFCSVLQGFYSQSPLLDSGRLCHLFQHP